MDPKTFGEQLRKTRIDTALKIKELTALIGVTQDTVINWELRGMKILNREIIILVDHFISEMMTYLPNLFVKNYIHLHLLF